MAVNDATSSLTSIPFLCKLSTSGSGGYYQVVIDGILRSEVVWVIVISGVAFLKEMVRLLVASMRVGKSVKLCFLIVVVSQRRGRWRGRRREGSDIGSGRGVRRGGVGLLLREIGRGAIWVHGGRGGVTPSVYVPFPVGITLDEMRRVVGIRRGRGRERGPGGHCECGKTPRHLGCRWWKGDSV